jgi:hypothetical protein
MQAKPLPETPATGPPGCPCPAAAKCTFTGGQCLSTFYALPHLEPLPQGLLVGPVPQRRHALEQRRSVGHICVCPGQVVRIHLRRQRQPCGILCERVIALQLARLSSRGFCGSTALHVHAGHAAVLQCAAQLAHCVRAPAASVRRHYSPLTRSAGSASALLGCSPGQIPETSAWRVLCWSLITSAHTDACAEGSRKQKAHPPPWRPRRRAAPRRWPGARCGRQNPGDDATRGLPAPPRAAAESASRWRPPQSALAASPGTSGTAAGRPVAKLATWGVIRSSTIQDGVPSVGAVSASGNEPSTLLQLTPSNCVAAGWRPPLPASSLNDMTIC